MFSKTRTNSRYLHQIFLPFMQVDPHSFTNSFFQVDPNNPIITLPDGTTAQVQGVATVSLSPRKLASAQTHRFATLVVL